MTRSLSLTLILAVLQAAPSRAQTDQGGAMFAPVVRTERVGAGVVRIVYNLQGTAGTVFAVALEASTDGGQTFTMHLRAVTGDVGPGVSAGNAKTIVWDSAKDVEDLQVDRYVFRVVVSTSEQVAAPSPAPAPTRVAAPKPSGGTPGGAKKGGGLSKSAIIAIAGGGAAAGVGVAVSQRKGGSGASTATPPPSTPSTQQTRNVTGPYSVPMSVVVTNPDGTNPCNYALTFTGTLTMTFDVVAGSVTGTAAFQGTYVFGATTCTAAGNPAPTPGMTVSLNIANISVTGAPSSVSFTHQRVGQGQATGGATGTTTLTFSFNGAVNAETVTGSFSVSYRDETTPPPRIGLGSGTVSVTLR